MKLVIVLLALTGHTIAQYVGFGSPGLGLGGYGLSKGLGYATAPIYNQGLGYLGAPLTISTPLNLGGGAYYPMGYGGGIGGYPMGGGGIGGYPQAGYPLGAGTTLIPGSTIPGGAGAMPLNPAIGGGAVGGGPSVTTYPIPGAGGAGSPGGPGSPQPGFGGSLGPAAASPASAFGAQPISAFGAQPGLATPLYGAMPIATPAATLPINTMGNIGAVPKAGSGLIL